MATHHEEIGRRPVIVSVQVSYERLMGRIMPDPEDFVDLKRLFPSGKLLHQQTNYSPELRWLT